MWQLNLRSQLARNISLALLGVFVLTAVVPVEEATAAVRKQPAPRPNKKILSTPDLQFLNKVTFGANLKSIAALKSKGRDRYLEEQLNFKGDNALPPAIAQQIALLDISKVKVLDVIAQHNEAQQKLKTLKSEEEKDNLKTGIKSYTNDLVKQAETRRFLRAIYSENQLQEQLTWFWFNHFNVSRQKGDNALLIADYEEQAIRPFVLGKFRDLVEATLKHPAMLAYLDNSQNVAGATNENYARELMELHTLGVRGGYTQADVIALSRLLTGIGVDMTGAGCPDGQQSLMPNLPKQPSGLFCFRTSKHDLNEKVFLGQTFPRSNTGVVGGEHYGDEVLKAIDLLVKQPATAQFISRKLATYFIGDNPPDTLVYEMAGTFQGSDGNIALTLKTMFNSEVVRRGKFSGTKYKDPVQYVLSGVRLFYGSDPIKDATPVIGWINLLGESLYDHQTPDGYGMTEKAWLSADQMGKRIEVAKAIAEGADKLYATPASDKEMAGLDDSQRQEAQQALRDAHPINSFAICQLPRPKGRSLKELG